jgi:hypothetical protein
MSGICQMYVILCHMTGIYTCPIIPSTYQHFYRFQMQYHDELDLKRSHPGINQPINHLYHDASVAYYWYIPVCTIMMLPVSRY